MPLLSSVNSPFGELLTALHLRAYREAIDDTGSPFFSPNTMRFFGTRSSSLSLIDRVVVIGCDSNAPEGYPKYWARVFSPDGRVDEIVARRDSRKAILKAAERVAFLLRLWNHNVDAGHDDSAAACAATLNKWADDPTNHF